MAKNLRAVLDANIYVSALLTDGSSRKVLHETINLVYDGMIDLHVSHFILTEVYRTLTQKLKFSEFETKAYIERIVSFAFVVGKSETPIRVVSDSNDNPIVETAIKANADFLVTNDNAILKLMEYQGTKMKTAAEFLYILANI